jgi:CDGSH-type Zn-finger protein
MARGGARPGAGRKAGKSANTSTPATRARARARVGSENQRPWPADKVERWSIREFGFTNPVLVDEDERGDDPTAGCRLVRGANYRDRFRSEQRVEPHRPHAEARPNGPYVVTGAIELRDTNGNAFATQERTVLCRCGASTKKPFCDGTHSKIGFQAAAQAVPDSAEKS